MSADLHIHTTASDGTWQPADLVAAAAHIGLETIAVTDHDTISNVAPTIQAAQSRIRVIPGIEFNTELNDTDIHILGYGIDLTHQPLLTLLNNLIVERHERAQAIIRRLNKLNIDINFESVVKIAGKGGLGRLHIARALVKSGFAASIQEAFTLYLNRTAPAYVHRASLSPFQAINMILASGGIPVLAHPGLMGSDDFIAELESKGLLGLEVIHPSHSAGKTQHYLKLAAAYGLLPTGGSDCHGPGGKDQVYLGTVRAPNQWVEKLEPYLTKLPR